MAINFRLIKNGGFEILWKESEAATCISQFSSKCPIVVGIQKVSGKPSVWIRIRMINGLTGCRKRNDLRLTMTSLYKDKIRQEQNHPNHINHKNLWCVCRIHHSSDVVIVKVSVKNKQKLVQRNMDFTEWKISLSKILKNRIGLLTFD